MGHTTQLLWQWISMLAYMPRNQLLVRVSLAMRTDRESRLNHTHNMTYWKLALGPQKKILPSWPVIDDCCVFQASIIWDPTIWDAIPGASMGELSCVGSRGRCGMRYSQSLESRVCKCSDLVPRV